MDDEALQRIYQWVDEIPLSRPKRNISRDFADGLLMAEMVAHYFPKLVEMHNYPPANSYAQKMYNWNTLNTRVFKKMGWQLNKEELEGLVNCQPQAVERTLLKLQQQMAKFSARKQEQQQQKLQERPQSQPSSEMEDPAMHAQPPVAAPSAASGRAPRAAPAAAAGGGARGGGGGGPEARLGQMQISSPPMKELLAEKDASINELRETVDILEIKISKLEQLVRLKDSKIATLQAKLQQANGQ